ncbi:MAG TPA: hypothetical protein DIC35_02235 [Candidatus Moranbacteria bacterium]|nr:hypothetical protein [Candidatus Moranbacteria bacterium]
MAFSLLKFWIFAVLLACLKRQACQKKDSKKFAALDLKADSSRTQMMLAPANLAGFLLKLCEKTIAIVFPKPV